VAAGGGYGTPASGHQAFVAPNQQQYGNAAADQGGGKRGLLIGLLALALFGCVGLVLAASGVFSGSKKPVTPLGGDGTSTTTAPTNTVVAPPDTSTTTAPTTLPALTTTPVTAKPTTTAAPKVDAGHAPTTTATATTTAPPATTPPTATTPPVPTPTPTPTPTTPPAATEPVECAQARTACAGGGMAQRAMCSALKKTCFEKGGKL
jgi:hypothetical protein